MGHPVSGAGPAGTQMFNCRQSSSMRALLLAESWGHTAVRPGKRPGAEREPYLWVGGSSRGLVHRCSPVGGRAYGIPPKKWHIGSRVFLDLMVEPEMKPRSPRSWTYGFWTVSSILAVDYGSR